MLKNKISMRHIILLFIVLTIIFRFDEIIQTLELLFLFIKLSFITKNFFSNQFSFEIADQFFSVVIFILIAIICVIYRHKWKLLTAKADLTLSFITALIFTSFLSPIISPFNPNLQFNLSIAKNLTPITTKTLFINIDGQNSQSSLNKYFVIKGLLMRDIVDDKYFLSDNADIMKESDRWQIEKNLFRADFEKQNYRTEKIIFLLGTDEFGRDVFSRLIYAIRLSIFIGIGAVLLTFCLGVFLGFVSGYYSKTVDGILNRFTEMFLSFPSLFLVILFLALFGNSLLNVIAVIGIAGWMNLFKIVRGEVILLKSKNFIITSKHLGMNKINLLRKEFFPFLIPSIVVNLVFQFANVIIAESSLSFLGLTGNHVYPTLGTMIQEGQYYLRQAWWIFLFPSIFIIVILFAVNNAGKRMQLKFNPFIKR